MPDSPSNISPEVKSYLDQYIQARRELKRLEETVKDLASVLLPEIEALGSVTIGDATIYKRDASERLVLSRESLMSELTTRYGASVAAQIIDGATRLSSAPLATIGIRFKAQ